jgi:hypothetical protein
MQQTQNNAVSVAGVPKQLKPPKGSVARVDGTAGQSDSDSDLEIEDEEDPEPTPAIISVNPPTDERTRAIYVAVQAVWYPRNKPAPVEKIKNGIAQFGDNLRNLRDGWKAKNDSLKKAELEGSATAAQAPGLKADAALYRQTLENLLNKVWQFSHPAIIKRYVVPRTLSLLCRPYRWYFDKRTALFIGLVDMLEGERSIDLQMYTKPDVPSGPGLYRVEPASSSASPLDSAAFSLLVTIPMQSIFDVCHSTDANIHLLVLPRTSGLCPRYIPSCWTESMPPITRARCFSQFLE